MRVILADDDRITARMLTSTLAKRKWNVLEVHDSMQALMFASRAPRPDVVVLDINMPGGTGYHALERLRASTKTQQIPVVVITGSTDPAARGRATALGANAFLHKPVDPTELANVILRVTGSAAPSPDDEPVPDHTAVAAG